MKKLILSLALLAATSLFVPNSGTAAKSKLTTDCASVRYETFNYWMSMTGDVAFSNHQADFAYHNCNNAGEPEVPQPPQ